MVNKKNCESATPPLKPGLKEHPQILELLQSDEGRDCTKFDPVERAKELFKILDADSSGAISEDEFVEGCMTDTAFVMLLDNFNDDAIWET